MSKENEKKQNNNKELSARLMAVQAYYEISQNNKPVRLVVEEYLERKKHEDTDGEEYTPPHAGLFKKILFNLDDRLTETSDILAAYTQKEAPPTTITTSTEETEQETEEPAPHTPKELEPLLRAILLCSICELLVHQDIDAPIIIDDYLNVTHAFYEQPQVSFVNGILDNAASLLRS